MSGHTFISNRTWSDGRLISSLTNINYICTLSRHWLRLATNRAIGMIALQSLTFTNIRMYIREYIADSSFALPRIPRRICSFDVSSAAFDDTLSQIYVCDWLVSSLTFTDVIPRIGLKSLIFFTP